MFELDERIRRLRETLAYLRNAALTDAAEVGQNAQAHGEWSKFLGELRELLSAAEASAPHRRVRKVRPPVVRKTTRARAIAETFRAGATLH